MTIMQNAVIHAEGHSRNSMFRVHSVHRHYPNYIGCELKRSFLQHGIDLNTPDISRGERAIFDLVCEGQTNLKLHSDRAFLLALENPYLNRLNRDHSYLNKFVKVFTWDTANFSLPSAVKVPIPWSMSYENTAAPGDRIFFSCIVNSNKNFKEFVQENLYSERIKVIRFFEENFPAEFNLYGFGWEKPPRYPGSFGHVRRQVHRGWLAIQGKPAFPSYRGVVEDKLSAYEKHKFAFCYENVGGLDNYVTEKIFDALRAGCIPIYRGAKNITDIVPADCFIDARKYANLESLYTQLKKLDDTDMLEYQRAGKLFLSRASNSLLDVRLFSEHVASIVLVNL